MVSEIQKHFLQAVPVRRLKGLQDDSRPLDISTQDAIVNDTVLSKLATKYPPSSSYAKTFLKALLQRIEAAGEEPSEILLSCYLNLLAANSDSEKCFKSYLLPELAASALASPPYITLREEQSKISQGTTGFVTWEAALKFAEYLLFVSSEPVKGRDVLELGAGAGLLGLVCAYVGARRVEMTDVDVNVLDRVRENVHINRPWMEALGTPPINVRKLDWEKVQQSDLDSIEADVLVSADVVYDPCLIGPLVKVISMFLRGSHDGHGRSKEAWIALTLRQEKTYHLFLNALEAGGIEYSKISLSEVPAWFYHEQHCGEVALLRATSEGAFQINNDLKVDEIQ